MKNPEHARHFEDVDIDRYGFGGLGGAAAEDHSKAKAKPSKEGVKIALDCDNCGAPNIVTVEWPEAIVISTGNLPRGWKFERGYIRPDIGCGSCQRLVSPGITPDEAQRWVKAGINARFVDPRHAQALAQQAARGGVR